MFDAVLFDFFGTLTTAVQRGRAHASIIRSLGCSPEVFVAALDRTFRDRATGGCGTPAEVLRGLAEEQGVLPDHRRLADAVTARVAAVATDVTLRPDAVRVLRAVRGLGLRSGLVSDCWYELPRFLPGLPVAALLDTTVYSVEIGHCKPHPAVYLAACDRLDVEPRRCLYVGDGGGRELSGARALGMTAVRLDADDLGGHLTFDPEPDWDGPSVRSLTDLLPMLPRVPAPVRPGDGPDPAPDRPYAGLTRGWPGRTLAVWAWARSQRPPGRPWPSWRCRSSRPGCGARRSSRRRRSTPSWPSRVRPSSPSNGRAHCAAVSEPSTRPDRSTSTWSATRTGRWSTRGCRRSWPPSGRSWT
jgi:putative hydrolase of the HAD superfamily